jgi:hypothetical protein
LLELPRLKIEVKMVHQQPNQTKKDGYITFLSYTYIRVDIKAAIESWGFLFYFHHLRQFGQCLSVALVTGVHTDFSFNYKVE